MIASASRGAAAERLPPGATPVRVAFVGAQTWLDGAAPAASAPSLSAERFAIAGEHDLAGRGADLERFGAHVTVLFDPPALPASLLEADLGVTLGVLVDGLPDPAHAGLTGALDRVVSFDPALTGSPVAGRPLWRAIPPPVSDALFAEVRAGHRVPRAMSVGRSTAHREAMLTPAKHQHDLLQVIHGVTGEALARLLGEYEVGVNIPSQPGGGIGQQAGVHLAAGQLLISEQLLPAHGLERNIDYLNVDSPAGIVWALDRLARFPEMHHRIRVRGRLKAEQFRASRLFARVVHDLLLDVAAFGADTGAAV
jgi:hypothetical protein